MRKREGRKERGKEREMCPVLQYVECECVRDERVCV
jgi:hypothetical protein